MSSEEKSVLQSMTDEIRRIGKIHGWKADDIKAKIAAVTALDKALEDTARGYKKKPGTLKNHPLDFYKAIIVARLSEIPPRHRAIELQRVLPVIGLNEDWLKTNGFSKGLFNARQLGKWIKANVQGMKVQKEKDDVVAEGVNVSASDADKSVTARAAEMPKEEKRVVDSSESKRIVDGPGTGSAPNRDYIPIAERIKNRTQRSNPR